MAHAAELPPETEPPSRVSPVFPYGAVYFPQDNPPPEDWARDHQTAAQTGMNIFRHWFMWSAIEVAPGKYDWSDYDRIMDLAAKNGIKVILEELVGCAPEWAFRKYPHARYLGSDDFIVNSTISESNAGGSYHSKRQGWAYTELPIERRYLGETNGCDERPASHSKCWRTGCGSDCFAIECSCMRKTR